MAEKVRKVPSWIEQINGVKVARSVAAFPPSFAQFYEFHTRRTASAWTSLEKAEDEAATVFDPNAAWIDSLAENQKKSTAEFDEMALSPFMRCVVFLLRDINPDAVATTSQIVEITNFAKRMIKELKQSQLSQGAGS